MLRIALTALSFALLLSGVQRYSQTNAAQRRLCKAGSKQAGRHGKTTTRSPLKV